MAVNSVVTHTYDLETPLVMTPLRHALASGDKLGDRFDIAVTQKGRPADLSGASVTGYFIRTADGATVIVNGTAAGNTASVTLPESCYAVPGRFTLTIKVSLGGVRHAVYVGEGAVLRSSTDTVIDPGHEIPDLDELLAMISQMESAASAAQSAAQQATGAAGSANSAAGAANSAATAANRAKGEADTAAANANAAAGTANASAAAADVATGQANAAADAANTAAGAATTATGQANDAAANANARAEYLANATFSAHTVDPGGSASVTETDEDGHAHFDFGLVKGNPGDVSSVWGVRPDDIGDAKPEVGGRNYITVGSNQWTPLEQNRWHSDLCDAYTVGADGHFQVGDKLVFSIELDNPSSSETPFAFWLDFVNDETVANRRIYHTVQPGERRKFVIQYTIPDYATVVAPMIGTTSAPASGQKFRNAKLERGVIPTDWSPAPEDKQDKIDMIGGTNLYTGTESWNGNWANLPEWTRENEEYRGLSVISRAEVQGGIGQTVSVEGGKSYTISFFLKSKSLYNHATMWYINETEGYVNVNNIVCNQYIYNYPTTRYGYLIPSTEWQRAAITFKAEKDGNFQFVINPGTAISEETRIYICGMKMEVGNVPTDWSPAPEDVLNYAAFAGDPNATNALNDNKWFRFASLDTAISYFNSSITFFMQTGMGHSDENDPKVKFGILTARVRTEEDFINDYSMYLKWLIANVGVNPDDFKMTLRKTDHNSLLFELWVKHTVAFQTFQFQVLAEGTRTDLSKNWNLYTNSFVGENLPEDALETVTSSVAPLLTAAAAAQEE